MQFVTTRGGSPPVSFTAALFAGIAPDGGLYVPETIEPWSAGELARLSQWTLTQIALRALSPFTRGDLDPATLEAVVVEALNFPIPLVEVQPGLFSLELFHGPTFAFKDVGARVMARLMAARHRGDDPLTVLAATSGDTGSAVAHAFAGVPNTRVVILYPDGRVSPTQEAQLTIFNGEQSNVRAYAVAGSFDDCHRLTREAYANPDLRRSMRLTSANSVNVGRLLPQSVYYFHAMGRLGQVGQVVFSTPSGNFGNLTAGLMAKRAGLPIARFIAATNVNDVVPPYLETGRFEPRPSLATLSNAMDVGHPSNFERMLWLYGGDVDAMRGDITGCRFSDDDVRATIKRVYEERGYLLDPHSAIACMGLTGREGRHGQVGKDGTTGVFLATAHPAKFAEIVEPIIGRPVEKPPALAAALDGPQHIIRIRASLDRVLGMLDG
ncbi:MAG TPA: threonine synthase [Vicinamibacterales bacterium]|nr:threonine synthase [Vicinamibacterales bacterium]